MIQCHWAKEEEESVHKSAPDVFFPDSSFLIFFLRDQFFLLGNQKPIKEKLF